MGTIVSVLWSLAGSLQLQELIRYVGGRIFVPPSLPIVDKLPVAVRYLPGVEGVFNAAVGAARDLYYYTGVGEGLVGGILLTMAVYVACRFFAEATAKKSK